MIEFSHDVNLVNQRLLTFLLTKGALLREGFDCILSIILMSNYEID